MTRRLAARRITAATLAALGVLVGTGAAGGGTAAADPIGDARARAAQLARTVDALQTRAEVAIERYNAVQSRLGNAVVRQSLAERQAETDAGAATAAADDIADRVRALYESGGREGLLATVLDGSDPTDAMARLHVVGTLLQVNADDVAAVQATSETAHQVALRLTAAATEVTRLQRQAADAAGAVRELLASAKEALAGATSDVRRLVAAQQAAAAAASAQDFLSALTAAGGSFSSNTTPPNAIADGAIKAARSRLGVPYVWGATGPDSFDCSGLTQWAYAHVGIRLPRVAADQWNAGPHVALDALQPGDLLFWATDVSNPVTIHHVAMYIGAGMMIAAPHTGDVVKVQPVYLSGYIGATRPYTSTG